MRYAARNRTKLRLQHLLKHSVTAPLGPPSRATVAPRGFLPDDVGNMRERARASRAAANKRKKPLGIGRAARCRELPGLTRFRYPLNNALLPVMFRAAHIFATCRRASVQLA